MKHPTKATLALLLTLCVTLGLLPTLIGTAWAEGTTTTYTLTIPATLTVANSGWNATTGITANNTTNDFDTGKKLTVTAVSTNNWTLKSGDNSIGYNLATATGIYNSTAEPASWEFTAAELNAASGGTNKPMGIIVEEYSSKPAGTYTDTVTFTASVVSATKKLTLTGRYDDNSGSQVTKSLEIEYTDNDTWKDIAERYDEISLQDNAYGPSEGKAVYFWYDMSQGVRGCELKSNESAYNYKLVSINDKVSTYSKRH